MELPGIPSGSGVCYMRIPWEVFWNKEVLDKRKQVGNLEIRVTRFSINLYLHNILWIYFKLRCLFESSPLCNYKYLIQCNFARVLQHTFLRTWCMWSDTEILMCVIASACGVCLLVCQFSCAEMSCTCAFKYLGLL